MDWPPAAVSRRRSKRSSCCPGEDSWVPEPGTFCDVTCGVPPGRLNEGSVSYHVSLISLGTFFELRTVTLNPLANIISLKCVPLPLQCKIKYRIHSRGSRFSHR